MPLTKTSLLCLFAALMNGFLLACNHNNSDSSAPSFSFSLTEVSRTAATNASVRSLVNAKGLVSSTAVQGLYFGELEIVAYNYRQGQGLQAKSGGYDSADWNTWIILQNGQDSARDTVLRLGGQIDIAAMNGAYPNTVYNDFARVVGTFQVDILEVNFFRTGIVYDGKYYGMNANHNGLATHPLHNYADLNGIPDFYTEPIFPNFSSAASHSQSYSAFFARKDWFPTQLTVEFDKYQTSKIVHSSQPLSQFQSDLLTSLVPGGNHRRFYENLIIIPYDGPVSITFTPTDAANTSGGSGGGGGSVSPAGSGGNTTPSTGTPTAGTNPWGASNTSAKFNVTFDLHDTLDQQTDLSVPTVVYKGDSRGIPFGLSVGITVK